MAVNWGQGAAGAGTGAMAGSTFGPLGALAGGVLGGLGGLFSGNDKLKKKSTMTKEQQALLNQILSMVSPSGNLGQAYGESLGYQQQLMDPNSEAVRQFTEPYMREFEQQTVPGLAERFAGAGGGMGGGLSSSGFGQALSSAGGNLQSQLAQLKAGLGQQAAQSLMGQYGNLTGAGLSAQPFAYVQPQMGFGTGLLQGYAGAGFPGMGTGLGNLASLYQKYAPIIGNV